MKSQDALLKDAAELRQKAEALAQEKASRTPKDSAANSPEEIQQTLHELRVHQIELEMQNEELRLTQEEIEAGRARYFGLYDLAPVGYCTLSGYGLILEVNLTAATLLGATRGALVSRPLSRFIFQEDQNSYFLNIRRLFEKGAPRECDLRLVKLDGTFFWAHMTARVSKAEDGAPVCRVVLSDITERKQAEEALKESEKSYEVTLKSLQVGVVVHDVDGRVLLSNPEASEILGLTKDQMLGKDLVDPSWSFVHDDLSIMKVEDYPVSVVVATKQPLESYQVGVRRKDRDYITWVMVNANPVFADNILDRIVVNFVDITERKQAEDELAAMAAQWQSTFDASNDAIWLIDKDHRVMRVNKTAETTFQPHGGSSIGKLCYEIIHGTKEPLSGCPVERARTSLHRECMELKMGESWYLITADPVLDAASRFSGIVHVASDITERKLAELALQESNERFRTLFDSSPDPVWIIDSQRFVECNQAAVEMMGYPDKDSLRNIHPSELSPKFQPDGEDSYSKAERMMLIAKEKGINRFEWVHRRRDQSDFFAEVTLSAITLQGRQVLYCIWRDITERKKAEQREKDLQVKLADAERRQSLGVLAGGIAHDLNNILGPIVLLPEMIDDVIQDPATMTDQDLAEARESLIMIKDSARRAANVVKDLKALGQSGHVDLQPLDANQLLGDYLETNDIKALHKEYPQVKIGSRSRHKNLTISANKTDLCRVLLNLIGNAAEAVPGRGEVEIDAEPISLAERKLGYEPIEAGNYVVIHVRDTGAGIPDDILKRMFEPFVTTKKTHGGRSGSGLGLSVVHSIMKDHHGYVDVERSTTKWTTTFFSLFPGCCWRSAAG